MSEHRHWSVLILHRVLVRDTSHWSISYAYSGVPTASGKSLKVVDFNVKFPGPGNFWILAWKVLEILSLRSLKVLEFTRNSNYATCLLRIEHCVQINVGSISATLLTAQFFATCGERSVTLYIHRANNCCLSVHVNIAGLWQSPVKMFWGSWKSGKSPGIFCKQESENPVIFVFMHPCGGAVGRVSGLWSVSWGSAPCLALP